MAAYSPSPPLLDHIHGPPRKKMRKGTKSCLECRRRKIKCTFEDGRPAICNECYARGSTCVDQEHGDVQSLHQSGDQSYSLRERVTQLEDLVKQVLDRLPEKEGSRKQSRESDVENSNRGGETREAAEVLKSLRRSTSNTAPESAIVLPQGRVDGAPVLSLFDNAVFSRREEDPQQPTAPQHNKSRAIIQALKSLLPSASDLEKILDAAAQWWDIWKKMFPFIGDPRISTLKESVSHSLRSDKPAEVAKILLCIAISMDQLPYDFEYKQLNLTMSARNLMEQYISTVDRLICQDEEIAATLDGIECMVLQGKYQINLGRPRRAWLLFRRAVGFAQLLGLHRSLGPLKGDLSPEVRRQQGLWFHLCQSDHYLALLLGLPYSIDPKFMQPPKEFLEGDDCGAGESYLLKVNPVVAKIVDRNQSPQNMPFSATLRIDAELEEITHTLSANFWSKDFAQAKSIQDYYDRLIAQFFHHQIRQFLHLPFMLKSAADKRYQYSHTAALESSREMAVLYRLLRSEQSVGPLVCKLVDFQAFTAAMLLLLNQLGYSQSHQNNDASQEISTSERDNEDWELVYATIAILNRASLEAGGIVAAQSAKALKMIAKARHGCDADDGDTCKISIPYFGTITIGAGKNFKMPKTATPVAAFRSATSPAQLPTPPCSFGTASSIQSGRGSVGGSSSAQMSPAAGPSMQYDSMMPPNVPPNPFGGNGLVVPDQNGTVYSDQDPFIAFDSYMALPGPGQFDTSGLTNSQNTSPGCFMATDENPSGFSLMMGMSNMDLDQGWNWFGTDDISQNPFSSQAQFQAPVTDNSVGT